MTSIRDLEETDIDVFAELLNNKNVVRFLSTRIPFPYSANDAELWIKTISQLGINKAIQHDGVLIGGIGVQPGQFENERCGEIGYWLGEPYWGRGSATKAVSAMTEYVFQTTEIVRLVAPVFSPNIASTRVLEKSGYYQESIQKNSIFKDGKIYDAFYYVKLKPY